MSITPTVLVSETVSHNSNHGKRLKHFFRPDGRTVHVAFSPEDQDHLRRTLGVITPEKDFDIYLHGSPEHLEAIRETHAYHEQKRETLRGQHGKVYEEFEHVHKELDTLAADLHMLTEHGVALDANFSKALEESVLTKSIGTKEPNSGRSSLHGDTSSDHESRDWEAERRKGGTLKFYKRPVIRQYIHKGLLWRAAETEEVASFELFVDLLYVGIIAINGGKAAEDQTRQGLLRFCITFILSWKIWADLTMIISWFETDDILQRICVLFVMICLLGLTTNIVEVFDQTYCELISFYLGARLFQAGYYMLICLLIPMIRGVMMFNTCMIFVGVALWISSIHVDTPQREALIWVTIALDLFGAPSLIFSLKHPAAKRIKLWTDHMFEFYPAINIEHKTERIGAFVTLVFGYSVVALFYQNKAPYGINAFLGKAILGLIQAFAFNWIYFEIDAFNLYVHAIRRSHATALLWLYCHLPFVMSFVLASAALARLVIAHDCPDANINTLSDEYVSSSAGNVTDGLRWLYCGGLGISLACMGILSITHEHKKVIGQRIKKRHRLTVRFAVAIIIICLSKVTCLNSLQLISTTTGLVVAVLVYDLLGSSCAHDGLCGEKTPCKYMARCQLKKKDLEHALKSGQVVNVEEMAERGSGEKGLIDIIG
ncbi:MAG: hypothetical protein M1827_002171 [Pycnora praestabilis]|nr:MAG: hypothetical protein M1827_002171 [Pycnora praestabilis]